MAKILLLIMFLLVSCGQPHSETTKTSKDQNFKEHQEKIKFNSLNLEKFQVNVRQFSFVRDRQFNIELERLKLEQYYLKLGLSDFLSKQLLFTESSRFHIEDLAQNEVYRIDPKMKYEYFQELNIPHLKPNKSEVIELLRLEFDIDLRPEILNDLAGVEINLWNQYDQTSFLIGYVPKENLKRSNYYVDNYLANYENGISLQLLKAFVNKELTLRFRLRFNEQEAKKVVFYHHSNSEVNLKEFKDFQDFRKYLDHENHNFDIKGNVISNLDSISLNHSFYYLIESDRKIIEDNFPFLRSKITNIEFENEIDFPVNATRIEFLGNTHLEYFNIQKRKQKLHTFVYKRELSKGTALKKIKHHCYVNYWKKIGVVYEKFSNYMINETDFSLLPEEIALYQNESNLIVSISNPRELKKIMIKARSQLFQDYRWGYADGLDRCATNPLEKVVPRKTEQISKSILTKENTLKLHGKLKIYFIPWDEIEYSRYPIRD